MKKTKAVTFAELTTLLKRLEFKRYKTEMGWLFKHSTEGLIPFRLYGGDKAVDQGDMWSTRLFLDYRGVLSEEDFDAFVEGKAMPA